MVQKDSNKPVRQNQKKRKEGGYEICGIFSDRIIKIRGKLKNFKFLHILVIWQFVVSGRFKLESWNKLEIYRCKTFLLLDSAEIKTWISRYHQFFFCIQCKVILIHWPDSDYSVNTIYSQILVVAFLVNI